MERDARTEFGIEPSTTMEPIHSPVQPGLASTAGHMTPPSSTALTMGTSATPTAVPLKRELPPETVPSTNSPRLSAFDSPPSTAPSRHFPGCGVFG